MTPAAEQQRMAAAEQQRIAAAAAAKVNFYVSDLNFLVIVTREIMKIIYGSIYSTDKNRDIRE